MTTTEPTPDPIEITTRHATTVDTLADAWRFVMERIDSLGEYPRIEISPVGTATVADMVDGLEGDEVGPWRARFEVVVEGRVEEARS